MTFLRRPPHRKTSPPYRNFYLLLTAAITGVTIWKSIVISWLIDFWFVVAGSFGECE
ncbi:hypothetical protein MtrunA17_Chr1g0183261 [Medicago truncatula]|uniref:Transmembrane protein n=1 Tax=Medicago truncatula TaxID=3880 RepID=A0A396JNW3_MEDTR|nr:hypothetical protein MtrunA17_Chr1g0183261 [Medicago truncatula]